tara:strand:- start:503 stop:895 length:393 start_codon:yes stop_codon:yes gene_type:complete
MPIFLGGVIYLGYRSLSLRMFDWFEFLGFSELIYDVRYLFQEFLLLPNWFYYSLPDGLWTYAFTSSFIIIWGIKNPILKYWLAIPLILSVVPEILQFYNLFPGTFDWVDLIFMSNGFILSILIFYLIDKK